MSAKKSEKVIIAVVLAGLAGIARADSIKNYPVSDAVVTDFYPQDGIGNAVQNDSLVTLVVGDQLQNRQGCAVFVFKLPALNAEASISKVLLRVGLGGRLGTIKNSAQIDLFFKDTGMVELSDSSTPAVASLSDFITPASANGSKIWSDDVLMNALGNIYAGGSVPSLQYAVFRVKMQGATSSDENGGINQYKLVSSETKNPQARPHLMITQ